jgi:fructose-bisphosphate aldolase class I
MRAHPGTIRKRPASIHVENVEYNRQALRELLFTAPDVAQYLSGVILFEEPLYQKTQDGKPFVEVLKEKGVLPGIKVDKRHCGDVWNKRRDDDSRS